jgi:hypothetical protein
MPGPPGCGGASGAGRRRVGFLRREPRTLAWLLHPLPQPLPWLSRRLPPHGSPPPPPGPAPWPPCPVAAGAWMPHRPPGGGRRRGLLSRHHWRLPQQNGIALQGPQMRLQPPQAPPRQTNFPAVQTPPARQPGTAAARLAPPWHWWWGSPILRDPTGGVQPRQPPALPGPSPQLVKDAPAPIQSGRGAV